MISFVMLFKSLKSLLIQLQYISLHRSRDFHFPKQDLNNGSGRSPALSFEDLNSSVAI